MILLSLLIWPLFSQAEAPNWSGISQCGVYQVSGIARTTKKGSVIVVNEKSQSEFMINVPLTNEAKLAPYIDKAMIATVNFEKRPIDQDYRGVIKDITSRIPNPLSPKDTGVTLLSEKKCKK